LRDIRWENHKSTEQKENGDYEACMQVAVQNSISDEMYMLILIELQSLKQDNPSFVMPSSHT
jgi:hypothetical protein